jgi:hypothetical protein
MARAILAATMLLASVPNCTDLYSIATHGLTQPSVTGTETPPQLQPDGSVLVTVTFTVDNPNDVPFVLDRLDYQGNAGTATLCTGTEQGVTIDGHSQQTIAAPCLISPASAPPGLSGTTVQLQVVGTALFDSPAGIPIDVDFSTSQVPVLVP